MNQRISKKLGNVATNSFFNENWQELEATKEAGASTSAETMTYVWGLRYVDDLVYRAKDNERLYSLADPNWNVVATTDSTGTVVERMKYDAFGKMTWLDEDFEAKNESDYAWNRTFTGQVLDAETGLVLYRNRYYLTDLGRFISRDPVEYRANDMNIYRYVFSKPLTTSDPYGLQFYDNFPGVGQRGCGTTYSGRDYPSRAWTTPDFFIQYLCGGGRGVTLTEIGLFDLYKQTQTSRFGKIYNMEQRMNERISSAQNALNCEGQRLIFFEDNDRDTSYWSSSETTLLGCVFAVNTNFAQHTLELKYSCSLFLECESCCPNDPEKPMRIQVSCNRYYSFYDRFTNVLDIGGAFGEYDIPFCRQYDMTEKWSDSYNNTIELDSCP